MRGPKGSKGLWSIICNWPEGGGGKRSLQVHMDQNCASKAFAREHCFFLFYRYIQCSLTYKRGELLQVSMLLLIVEKRYWQNFKQIGTGKLFLGENEMCYGIMLSSVTKSMGFYFNLGVFAVIIPWCLYNLCFLSQPLNFRIDH